MIGHALDPALFRGLAELEATQRGWLPHRLPGHARARCSDPQVAAAESQPSGVRLAFRTRATVIEIDVLPTRVVISGVPPRPDGTVDLLVDGELTQQHSTTGGDRVTVDPRTGRTVIEPGAVGTVRFDGLPRVDKDVEVWLPHHERVEVVALRTDAPITMMPRTSHPTWLHHGSSISQGSNAASPSTTWPAIAAAQAGVDVTNLGLAGSAMLDPFTARTIRDTPADLLSLEIGINLVNGDVMRRRAFEPAVHGFLDTMRDGHPVAPLLVIGPLYCPIHENTTGPSAFDPDALAAGRIAFRATGEDVDGAAAATPLDRLTLSMIRTELSRIVAQRAVADPQLFYLDGCELYGPADAPEHPLADNLHPDAATHRIIGERFARLALTGRGPLTIPNPAPQPQ
ncbi:GDSL-type esterase/lipase family protein [Mycolicibacterium sp.]|uniref:GDSL-type esterase/lipase family protein n=1 Tax=Mycolicibacterium sp. TaxID=2320850 RepID=UPI003D14FDC5